MSTILWQPPENCDGINAARGATAFGSRRREFPRRNMNDETLPIPAATIVLYHESGDDPAAHLMITRAAEMAFAAGALVFPGGRVDEDDRAVASDPLLARNAPVDPDDAAARVTAIREAIEETGLAPGLHPRQDLPAIARWRAALSSHQPFGALLRQSGATLDLGHLVPFSRWSPRNKLSRRFDTRFYVARFDSDTGVVVDASEASHHVWISARDAIEASRAGKYYIIFPTMRNLERLAEHPRYEAVLEHLKSVPVMLITPEVREYDKVKFLCLPEDSGYPVTRVPLNEVVLPR
jgi:8-oxo-dGTP pyrophosphatase MutT (NUDIX family)